MDPQLVFDLVLLVFSLMLLAAILYVPYKIFQFCVRGIAKSTTKTYHAIIPSKK